MANTQHDNKHSNLQVLKLGKRYCCNNVAATYAACNGLPFSFCSPLTAGTCGHFDNLITFEIKQIRFMHIYKSGHFKLISKQ